MTNDAPPTEIPELSLPETLQKVAGNWAWTRLAHEGMMLEKIMHGQRTAKVAERFALTGDAVEAAEHLPGDEDMSVSIGNEIHNHYPAPPPSPSRVEPDPMDTPQIDTQRPPPVPQAVDVVKRNWPKYAIAAALLASGVGVGAAIPLLFSGGTTTAPAVEPVLDHTPPPPSNVYDIEKWVPGQ